MKLDTIWVMSIVRGVLLDWRGTLAAMPTESEWIGTSMLRVGRQPDPVEVARILAALTEAVRLPDIQQTWSRLDTSAALHRDTYHRLFAAAGIDTVMADALYATECDPALNPFAVDVPEVMTALAGAGTRIAVISDIHFDLRPSFVSAGLDQYVDYYALSFEQKMQKPDKEFFELALGELGVAPADALMVGDRPTNDGGAVAAGIPTLLLPTLHDPATARLHRVTVACGVQADR
jgi:FMN phosphatase YigB (HAD superfamily)